MIILRHPTSIELFTDPHLLKLVSQRFLDICADDDYDADLHGFMIVAEPGDKVQLLEAESGCPILRSYIGTARYGDPDFRPVFECLFEHTTVSDHLVTPYRDRLGDARIASAIFEWRTQ